MTRSVVRGSTCSFVALTFVVLTVVLQPVSASAQTTYVWNTSTSGEWDTPSQWTPAGPANGASNTADFNTRNIDGFIDVGMATDRTIGHLIFGDTDNGATTPGVFTVFNSTNTDPNAPAPGARILTLSGTSTPTITVNQLGEVAPGINDVLIQDVNLAGNQGFIKNGAGVLTLTGPATAITGPVVVNGGTLRLDSLTVPVTGALFGYAGGAQTISSFTLANGTTLDLNMESQGAFNTAANIMIPANASATIRAGGENLFMNNVDGAGAGQNSTVNLVLTGVANDTYTSNGSWDGIDTLNITGTGGATTQFRMEAATTGGRTPFVTNTFGNTTVNLDSVNIFVRANSGGNNVPIGTLTGTATSQISGGNGGNAGGSPPRYVIGSLNQDSVFAGTVNGVGGITINKVGTETLTLSGPMTAGVWINSANADPGRKSGVVRVTEGTLAITGATSIPGGTGADFNSIQVLSGATLDVSGVSGTFSTSAAQQVFGSGTIVGNYLHDEGRIHPADTAFVDNDTDLTNVAVPTAGNINFNGNLTLAGGDIAFDMATTPASGNDRILVTGTASVAGGGVISPNFLAGAPAAGLTYTVLQATGGIPDSPAGWSVTWPGRGPKPTVFKTGNLLQFTTTNVAAVGNVTWTGVNSGDWDIESPTTNNWLLNGVTPNDYFQGDHVTFPQAGVSNFNVNVTTNVTPSSVVVDSTTDYTFSGTGVISGTGTFTKRGSSTLNMALNNNFSGAAAIEGGTVDIGAAGGALGTGNLTMSGGTVISTAGGLTNSGITLATGSTNTIRADGAAGAGSAFGVPNITSAGATTLNLTTEVVDKNFSVGATDFSGTLNIAPSGASNLIGVRLAGYTTTMPNLIVNLTNAVLSNRVGGADPAVFEFGELHGDAGSILDGFTGGSADVPEAVWQIGALNTNSNFDGTIIDGQGTGTATNVSSVTKVGTGMLTLTNAANAYGGDTRVLAGTLSITNPFLDDDAAVRLSTGATLNLNFGSLATIDTVDSLWRDGLPLAAGTYGRIGSGAMFERPYFTGDGILSVANLGTLPGDFDNDFDVDGIDFLIWQRGGSPRGPLDPTDLADWEANYGAQPGPLQAAVSTVPEPTSALLMALGLGLFGATGRRRRLT